MSTYREQLADALIPVAMELAFTVRTGTADDVAAVLDKVHPVHLHALAVVLAAAVDIDRTEEDLFGWSVDELVDESGDSVRDTWRQVWPRMTRSGLYAAKIKINRAEADRVKSGHPQ